MLLCSATVIPTQIERSSAQQNWIQVLQNYDLQLFDLNQALNFVINCYN